MKLNDMESVIPNSDCYFCYSINLHMFLKNEKHIEHINCGVHKKTHKAWFAYLKTDYLDEALQEWTNRKKNGDMYIETTRNGGRENE